MNVVIYGHDYPALVTAASLASNGNQVCVIPVDAPSDWSWRDTAKKQIGLSELMVEQQETGRLCWQAMEGVEQLVGADVHILSCSPTNSATALVVVQQLAPLLKQKSLLVTQTLHGVGKAKQYQFILEQASSPCQVLVWPEFLSEGSAIAQFNRPDRIIFGSTSEWAIEQMKDLLRPYNRVQDKLLIMSQEAAEMTKYAINMLLALRVSAMNEFANLADKLGVDIEQVRQGIGTDPRIGFNYLYPGAGFGGPNFMSDLQAMQATFASAKQETLLLPAALQVNGHQQEILFHKVWQHYRTHLHDKTFALWGVSYKPDTSTIEEASSLRLIDALLAQGAKLRVHDPQALDSLRAKYGQHPQLVYCEDAYEACDGAQALLIMTEWKVYWNPDFMKLKQLLRETRIFDGRNIYDAESMKKNGFMYHAIGRDFVSGGH